MSFLRVSLVSMTFLVFASQAFVFLTFAEVSTDEAASALADAEGAVVSAYQAALKAEEAGANVSGLMVRLNEAGGFLASARMAYRLGDFEEAVRLADFSRSIGVKVKSDAIKLRDSGLSEGLQRMMFTMVGSVLGVALVALGSFWVWRFLKKRYGSNVVSVKAK